MSVVENADKLKSIFGIETSTEYTEYTALKDVKAGFSVKRKYPPDIRFKPPVNQKGEPDALAMIHVLCQCNHEAGATKDQIILIIATFERYRSKYYDYNFEDPECPTKDSILISQKTPRPLAIENNDSYFYDREIGTLVDVKRKHVKGKDILDELFDKHCETVHLLKGMPLRVKIKTSRFLSEAFKLFGGILEKSLRIIWDKNVVEVDDSILSFGKVKLEQLKHSGSDSVNLFGYKISAKMAVLFSVLIIFFFCFTYYRYSSFFKYLLSNPLLTTCSAIIILYVLNSLMPKYLILPIVNLCRNLKWRFIWKKHKA